VERAVSRQRTWGRGRGFEHQEALERMIDGGRMQEQHEDDRHLLRARLEVLAAKPVALRETLIRTAERAAVLQNEAARIRAHSRVLRGVVLRVTLDRDPASGRFARGLLEEYLDGCPVEVVCDAKMVASELINNAYRHGEGEIELKVERDARCVRIDVADEGPTGAVRVQRARGRRGLEIVDALSLRWGAYAGSTHVWAELPIAPERTDLS